MKVFILAGGVGKRMFPIEKDKCFIRFLGKELILHQIEKLNKVGLKDIVIIGNPHNIDDLKKLCGNDIEYAVQMEPNGMADALLSVEDIPDEALIVSADDIFDEEAYEKVINAEHGDSVILGYEVDDYFPGGYLIVEEDRMRGIIEKPGPGNEPSNLVNIVVHLHRKFPDLVRYFKTADTSKDDQYEVAMDDMLNDGYDFRVARYSGFWASIKFPWHILDVRDYYLDRMEGRISPSAKIDKSAIIIGNVIIEDDVRVLENATIKGPCYIGRNAIIGNNAFLWKNCQVGERSVIGFSSELKYSYIGDGTFTHQSYVGDSIIMDNCNIAAGTITANYRFDIRNIKIRIGDNRIDTTHDHFGSIIGSDCKTGVNVSLMPGVRVGRGAIIGAGVVLTRDVDRKTIVRLKQDLEIVGQ